MPDVRRRAPEQGVRLHGVAVEVGFGQLRLLGGRIDGALGNSSRSGSEMSAISRRVQFHTEDRARPERGAGDALLRHGRGAGHLDPPGVVLTFLVLRQPPTVWSEQDEVQLGVVGLSHELTHHTGQRDDLGLVVHRE